MEMKMTKKELAQMGIDYITEFCKVNNIEMPVININTLTRASGFYQPRLKVIQLNPNRCAAAAVNPGHSWSHPHYFVDRTPVGVVCHEFGHYLHDILTGQRMVLPQDKPITSYEPDHFERFAESIKLFITNPDLLRQYCPNRYIVLTEVFGLKPIFNEGWKELMEHNNMNPKFIAAAEKRIKMATKKSTTKKSNKNMSKTNTTPADYVDETYFNSSDFESREQLIKVTAKYAWAWVNFWAESNGIGSEQKYKTDDDTEMLAYLGNHSEAELLSMLNQSYQLCEKHNVEVKTPFI